TGSAGTGSAGTGSAGTGSAGTGSAGTGSANTGLAGTGFTGTASVETESAGTGTAGTGPAGVDPDLAAAAANDVPAEGGLEAESLAAVRARIGDSVAEVTRAVTAEDYRTLAVSTPGVAVARCHVGIGDHPRYPCSAVPGAVTVRIVPGVPDPVAELADPGYDPALLPDPGALQAVRARPADAPLLRTQGFLRPPADPPGAPPA